MSLTQEYFKLTAQYMEEYGPKTILLMNVGSWFEIYGIKNPITNEISGSKIGDLCRICDLNIGERAGMTSDKGKVVMNGFNTNLIEKYTRKLQEAQFTCVVYEQDATKIRARTMVISPGTYFPADTANLSNNITCVWLYLYESKVFVKGKYVVVGIANLDVFTGETSISQFRELYVNNPTTFDELEKLISIYNPSEAIIISNLSVSETDDVVSYADIKCSLIHRIHSEEKNIHSVCIKNCEKQTYQTEILNKFYKIDCANTFMMNFYENNIACQAFCYLLDFVYQHNPHLVYKIKEPRFEDYSDKLVLANHSLKQLNVIDDSNHTGKLSSVSSLLNDCVTPMGKRKFLQNFLNPTTKIDYLQREYDITEHVIQHFKQVAAVRQSLQVIKDMTKWGRHMFMKKMTPRSFCSLLISTNVAKDLFQIVSSDPIWWNYFLEKNPNFSKISSICDVMSLFIDSHLNVNKANDIDTASDFEINFFQFHFHEELDSNTTDLIDCENKLEAIREYLHSLIESKERKDKKAQNNDRKFVKIYETEKNSFSLLCTVRRCKLLESILSSSKTFVTLQYVSSLPESETKCFDFKISNKDVEFHKQNSTENYITNEQISQLCKRISTAKHQLKSIMNRVYSAFVEQFNTTHQSDLDLLIHFITLLDIVTTKAFIAEKYHYCKPNVVGADKSFFKAKNIRHCLIEHLQSDELYVANDVTLGNDGIDGILLYGTNAVGKTSLIRSIGIAIIMAQSGMFVPCEHFMYSPYKYLFTRIIGNDNLFKGLSTFAVEMSELRTILRLSNENSLVLGDELCSGTESISAVSIFVAGIQKLHRVKSSFIFATHLHEIVHYEEITGLSSVVLKHLTVQYDKELDLLVYDRKIKDGSGTSLYGLEVCKSLKLPRDFLEAAFAIRMKYYPEQRGILSLKTSHFNSQKVMNLCEKCNENAGTEVHHLQHQKNADSAGFIKTESSFFHKNTAANLMTLCEKCHDQFHKSQTQHKRVKTSGGTILQEL